MVVLQQMEVARAKVPHQTEVLCMFQNDSWFRDSGPTVRMTRHMHFLLSGAMLHTKAI